jgi:hypothetical protein
MARRNEAKRAFEVNSQGRRKDRKCLHRVECRRFQPGSQAEAGTRRSGTQGLLLAVLARL